MEYKEFCKAVASYRSPVFPSKDEEETAGGILNCLSHLCFRLKGIDNLDALARVVCSYSLDATNPGQKKTAEEAAEALAQAIEINQTLELFGETIERTAQALFKRDK